MGTGPERVLTARHYQNGVDPSSRGHGTGNCPAGLLGLGLFEQSADGVHRRLHVSAEESGEPVLEWFIDGEVAAFDVGGRAWLQPVLDWLNENAGWDS